MREFNDFKDRVLGDDAYGLIIRVVGIALAIALWYVSMRFSVSGFQIASQENAWVGWVLGLTVTYLQVVFNRGTRNKTLYTFGIMAYVYGLATNLIGIMALRDTGFTMEFFNATPLGFLLQLVIVVGLAMTVEVLPEHLFILGLRDDDSDESDFVDSLSGFRDVFANRNPRQRRSNGNNQSKKNKNQKRNQNQNQNQNQRRDQGHGQGQPRRQQQSRTNPEVYFPVERE